MSEPSVCCLMITANRPEMAKRAVECFKAQAYDRKNLVIVDGSEERNMELHNMQLEPDGIAYGQIARALTIGELRNLAASKVYFALRAEILIHWDDDDISHPNRISEQVALLQSSGADAVGYNECLFWRDPRLDVAQNPMFESGLVYEPRRFPGEAWLYSNSNPRYVLGTSLCYWRKAWEKRPFEALNDGEDTAWRMGVNCIGVSSLFERRTTYCVSQQPRMICSIHAGNTSPWYRPELLRASEKQGGEWKRAEAWDDFCRERMTLGVAANK